MTDYAPALTEYIEENRESIHDCERADASQRFLLVECSRFDNSLFLTTWATPAEAAEYHDRQEHPEDWPVLRMVDLATGEELGHATAVARRTVFTEVARTTVHLVTYEHADNGFSRVRVGPDERSAETWFDAWVLHEQGTGEDGTVGDAKARDPEGAVRVWRGEYGSRIIRFELAE